MAFGNSTLSEDLALTTATVAVGLQNLSSNCVAFAAMTAIRASGRYSCAKKARFL